MIKEDELFQVFIEEAHNILSRIHEALDQWQKSPLPEFKQNILRELHTLKGSAKMVGLSQLGDYLHAAEQLFAKIDEKGDDDYLPAIYHALDNLTHFIEKLAQIKYFVDEKIPVLNNQEKFLGEGFQPAQSQQIRIKTTQLENFGHLLSEVNIAHAHLVYQLKPIHQYLQTMINEIQLMQEKGYQSEQADKYFASQLDSNNLSSIVLAHDQLSFIFTNSVNRLHNLAGQTQQLMNNFNNVIGYQKRVLKRLTQQITHTRLVSVEALVPRLQHIVRQVAHELVKEVQLKIIKLEGEVDRNLLEKLISLLAHLLRNAIDHGIEFPQERARLDKPSCGLINLSVLRRGSQLMIELSDDGQGLDVEKVRTQAIEKNLWAANLEMSKEEAIKMIFFTGFSTKQTITAISGQGIGLDVVQAEINKLGGLLQVETQPIGLRFVIQLPLLLALNQALIFVVGEQYYGIILAQLRGVERIAFSELKHKEQINYNQSVYRLYHLSVLLNQGTQDNQADYLPVIFLAAHPQPIALVVDRLIGSREILMRPLSTQLQAIKEFRGVALLAEDEIALILDLGAIIQAANDHEIKKNLIKNPK